MVVMFECTHHALSTALRLTYRSGDFPSICQSKSNHCATKVIAKWGDKLGGADVSTPGHCWVMQEYLNINGMPRID